MPLSGPLCLMQSERPRDEHTVHLKEWLEVAQRELQITQSQLQESDAKVRKLSAQLATARQEKGGAQVRQQRQG